MSGFRLWPVNFEDGMLVGARHLNRQADYVRELAGWLCLARLGGHGLVRQPFESPEALEYSQSRHGSNLRVSVQRLTAITPAGQLLYFTPESAGGKKCEIDIPWPLTGPVSIWAVADPDGFQPAGKPVKDEAHARYTDQQLLPRLMLPESATDVAGGFELLRLTTDGDDAVEDPSFVPAAVTITAHAGLRRRANALRGSMRQMVDDAKTVHKRAGAARELGSTGWPGTPQYGQMVLAQWVVRDAARPGPLEDSLAQLSDPIALIGWLRDFVLSGHALLSMFPMLAAAAVHELLPKIDKPPPAGRFDELHTQLEGHSVSHRSLGEALALCEEAIRYWNGLWSYWASGPSDDGISVNGVRWPKVAFGELATELTAHGELKVMMKGVLSTQSASTAVALPREALGADFESRVNAMVGANTAETGESMPATTAVDADDPRRVIVVPSFEWPANTPVEWVTLVLSGLADTAVIQRLTAEDVGLYRKP